MITFFMLSRSLGVCKFYFFLLFFTTAISFLYAQSDLPSFDSWQEENINLAIALSSSEEGLNSSIIDALKLVPRHLFINNTYTEIAYEDISLPGAESGSIPAPSDIVTALGILSPGTEDKVLVAGNNAGYCAAILSRLVSEVYLIEETSAVQSYPSIYSSLGFDNIFMSESPEINSFNEIIAFDRIFIHGAVEEISEIVTDRLSIKGNITFILSSQNSFQQIVSLKRSLLGDSVSCGGSCYFPRITKLKISNQ